MDFWDELITRADLLFVAAVALYYGHVRDKESKKVLIWLRFLNARVHQLEAAMAYIDKYHVKADIPYSSLSTSPETTQMYEDFANQYNLEQLHLHNLHELKKKK